MAKARPLVGGFLERISVKAFDTYYREITDLVRTQHGVYALYKNDRLYYVGLAINLRRRIKQHLRDKHAGRWNRFSLYLVRKVDHTREIEALLLRIADPKGNDQGGRLSRATNLEPQLRKMMETRQRAELEEIFRTQTKSEVKRAGKSVGRKSQIAVKAKAGTILKQLAGKRLFAEDDGKKFKAVVRKTGRINFNRQLYNSLSAAGKAARNRPTNGWTFWHVRKNGKLVKLDDLRKGS